MTGEINKSMPLQLPKFLNIPAKLYPMILKLNLFRYFLIEGGRGSAKSQSAARLILFIGDKNKVRVVCGREIQASIEESVYALFVDLIQEYGLNYDVGKKVIRHRVTGTTIRFRGFRERGSVNIKGIEGVDILFIDESQALTKQTLKILIPTIRKNKAKIFFVMNRHIEEDPAFDQFHNRDDCLHIHIDYFENQHCTDALKREAAECKKKNIDDYNHIWLGVALKNAKNSAFYNIDSIVDYDLPERQEPIEGFHYSLGTDLAKRVTHTAIDIICIELKILVYHERLATRSELSWNHIREKVLALGKKYNNAIVVPDSTGVGDPITEDLQRMGASIFIEQTDKKENPKEIAGFKFSSMSKENLIEKLRISIELQCFRIPDIESLKKSLKRYLKVVHPGGRVKYCMPSEKDEFGNPLFTEDEVLSLALALWGSRTMIYDPAYKPKSAETETDRFWKSVKRQILTKESQDNSLQLDDSGDIINLSDGIEIKEELL